MQLAARAAQNEALAWVVAAAFSDVQRGAVVERGWTLSGTFAGRLLQRKGLGRWSRVKAYLCRLLVCR
jgi:hypothetical protein